MKALPTEITQLKNKLNNTEPFLILLDITLNNDEQTIIRLARNTEDVEINTVDPSVTVTYTAFNFELDILNELNSGEIPSLKLRVANQERTLQTYLEELDGMVGSTVKITIISNGEPNLDYSELSQTWDVVQTNVTEEFVDFQLSVPNLLRIRFPLHKFIANHCQHTFRLIECGYDGELATCKRTLDDCEERENTPRFGGFVGLSSDGVRVV